MKRRTLLIGTLIAANSRPENRDSVAGPGRRQYSRVSLVTRIGTAITLAVAFFALGISSAMARNQWSDYHWEFPKDQTQLTININDCQTGPDTEGLYGYNKADHFLDPNDDWHAVINGSTGAIAVVDGTCPANVATPTDPIETFGLRVVPYNAAISTSKGTVNAFNADYANTGWVGVAIVELIQSSGDNHIVYGETHLNDYYAGIYAVYNDNLVMRKVQCQEVGHTFGVDHVKKDNSCMYSSMAFIGSTYEPHGHDGGIVNEITHGHSTSEPPPPDDGGGDFCDRHPGHKRCLPAGGVFRGKATWAEGYESREEMFEAADVVVSARVLNGSLFDRVVGAPGRGLPVSQAILQIQETFKGNANGVIRIEHTRGLGLEIEDDPGYVNGDDYLLFLRQLGARTFRVVNPSGRIPQ